MIAIESIRICLSAAAMGPWGSRMFIGHPSRWSNSPAQRTHRNMDGSSTAVIDYTAEIMTASPEHLCSVV
jgi:hypothetical protein